MQNIHVIFILLLLILSANINAASQGLIASYSFDEGSGSIANDINGNSGIINGASWVSGKFSNALQFDGLNDFVDIATNQNLNSYPITIMAWVKTDSNVTNVGIINKYPPSNGYLLYMAGGKIYAWYFRDNANHVWRGLGLDGGQINDNTWHHVAFTVDAAGGNLYVDGILKATRGWTGTPGPTNSTQNLYIGKYGNNYFSGSIDEVKIFNIALTQEEIQSEMNPQNSSLLQGDINGDSFVNMQDIILIVNDFGKTSNFDPAFDLSPSGEIDIFDVMVIVRNWGITQTNSPPLVSLTSPSNGAAFTEPATILLTADASDLDGTISRVEFYNGNSLLNSDSSAPYSFSWNSVTAGSYTITARAYDDKGAITTSSAVSISVTGIADSIAPTVAITSPLNGAAVLGTVSISAAATDNVAVVGVQFKTALDNLGAEDLSSPYSVLWNTAGFSNGTYTLTAVARDAAGNTASNSVTVNVANAPIPPVPEGGAQHDYFNALVARPDFYKGYSLRPQAGAPTSSVHDEKQLNAENKGGLHASECDPATSDLAFRYNPSTDPDPHRQDAAKAAIPAFAQVGGCDGHTLMQAMDAPAAGTSQTITISDVNSPYTINRAMRIDDELMLITARDTVANTVTVTRGAYGSTPAAHAIGTVVRLSANQMSNYLAVPIGTSDGNTYLITWDSYFTDSYVGVGRWNTGQKTYQFTNAGNNKMFEPKVQFSVSAEEAPGFNMATDIGIVTGRSYQSENAGQFFGATWADTNGNTMGPGWVTPDNLRPRAGTFIVEPNKWTRWWVKIDQRANDWDYFDMWVADEDTEPVLVYSQVSLSVNAGKPVHSVAQFWLAHGDSNGNYLRGGLFDLVAYHRNWVVLKNPADISSLFVKPIGPNPNS